MARFTKYPPGAPSWADVASPDLEASKAFYSSLFGWSADPSPEPEAMGYTLFKMDDAPVAGLGPTFEDMRPFWGVYVTVADVDASLATVRDAGGQVLMGPMDVFEDGRMAVISDHHGAAIRLWQPLGHIGAEVRNEPGAMCWVELATRDAEGSAGFYKTLFGWESQQVGGPAASGGPGYDYLMLQLGSMPVGGIITMDDNWPAEVPPHWMVYFAVADCDAAAARVAELGGEVCVPPTDIPPGRFSVVGDPHGATFTIIALNPELFGPDAAG